MIGLVLLFAFALSIPNLKDDLDVPPPTPLPTPDETSMVYFFTPEAVVTSATPFILGIELLAKAFNIPDYSGTIKTSIGKIDVSLTDMIISKFTMGELNVSTDPMNQTVYGYIDDNDFSLQFNYSIKMLSFPYTKDSGSGTVSTEGLSMNTTVSGGLNEDEGTVYINIDSFNFDIGDFNIDLQGGIFASIADTLESLFSNVINELISNTFSEFIELIINPMIDSLQMDGFYNCNDIISCYDYRVTQDPVVEDRGVRIYVHGTAYNGDYPEKNVNEKCRTFPLANLDKMLYVQLGNETFQSLLDAMQMENYFNSYNTDKAIFEPSTISYDDIIKYFPEWGSYSPGTNGLLTFTVVSSSLDSGAKKNPRCEITIKGLKITIDANVSLVPSGITDTTNIAGNIRIVLIGDVYWRLYHYQVNPEILEDNDYITIDVTLSDVYATDNDKLVKTWLEDVVKNIYIVELNKLLDQQMLRIYASSGLIVKDQAVSYTGDYVLISENFDIDMSDFF